MGAVVYYQREMIGEVKGVFVFVFALEKGCFLVVLIASIV